MGVSLLNDMLRDLEQRKSPGQPGVSGYAGLSAASANAGQTRKPWLLPVAALTLVLAGGAGFYGYWMTSRANVAIPVAQEQPDQEALQEITDTAAQADVAVITTPVPEVAESSTLPVVVPQASLAALVPEPESQSEPEPEPAVIVAPVAKTEVVTEAVLQAPVAGADVPLPEVKPGQTASPAVASPPKMDEAPKAIEVTRRAQSVEAEVRLPVTVESPPAPVAAVVSPPSSTPLAEVAPLPHATPLPAPPKVEKTLQRTPAEEDAHLVTRAQELFRLGKASVAEQSLREHLRLAPAADQSRELLAAHLLDMARFAELDALLQPGHWQRNARLRAIKARQLLAQGDAGAALLLLESDVPEVATHTDYHALMAALYQQEGRPAEAVNQYALLLAQDAEVADWWAGMAIALERSGNPEGARQAYTRALKTFGLHEALARYARERISQL